MTDSLIEELKAQSFTQYGFSTKVIDLDKAIAIFRKHQEAVAGEQADDHFPHVRNMALAQALHALVTTHGLEVVDRGPLKPFELAKTPFRIDNSRAIKAIEEALGRFGDKVTEKIQTTPVCKHSAGDVYKQGAANEQSQ